MTALYKVTGPNGEPLHGGSGAWPLPTDTEPGDWREVTGGVVACVNGLHLTDLENLYRWLPPGDVRVWRTETDGQLVNAGEKYAAQRVRLLPGPIDGATVLSALREDRIPVPPRGALAGMTVPKGHILEPKIEQARADYDAACVKWQRACKRAATARQRRIARLFA